MKIQLNNKKLKKAWEPNQRLGPKAHDILSKTLGDEQGTFAKNPLTREYITTVTSIKERAHPDIGPTCTYSLFQQKEERKRKVWEKKVGAPT